MYPNGFRSIHSLHPSHTTISLTLVFYLRLDEEYSLPHATCPILMLDQMKLVSYGGALAQNYPPVQKERTRLVLRALRNNFGAVT